MIVRVLGLVMLWAMMSCDTASIPRAPEVGAMAPAYTALSMAGDSIDLGAHEGEVILLNVWATWCIPCREEIPALQRLHERFGEQGLRIVGVSVDARGEEANVRDFASSFGVTYDVWLDPAEQVISTFRVIGVPNTFLIDREGIIRWKHIGPVLDDDPALLARLQEALES
jgi:cytochrome c biogenesis protein CcmG, thiol:disulfide interchange protein DsbE